MKTIREIFKETLKDYIKASTLLDSIKEKIEEEVVLYINNKYKNTEIKRKHILSFDSASCFVDYDRNEEIIITLLYIIKDPTSLSKYYKNKLKDIYNSSGIVKNKLISKLPEEYAIKLYFNTTLINKETLNINLNIN